MHKLKVVETREVENWQSIGKTAEWGIFMSVEISTKMIRAVQHRVVYRSRELIIKP